MGKKQFVNPFPVTTYLGPDYFCDRSDETSQMISNIRNGSSTTVIALRRIGKTGLIHHLLGKLPPEWKGIYIDILETETLNQFLNLLATSIITTIPEKSVTGNDECSVFGIFRCSNFGIKPYSDFGINNTVFCEQ